MGYKKPTETTKAFLVNSPLPTHGDSYAIISHADVIASTHEMLNNCGFTVTNEIYKANMDARVAQGIYYIKPKTEDPVINLEDEIGMMFAWTNSYDKSTRFQCAIGGYVFVCNNGMVAGDMMNFARKHTGTAYQDIRMQISNQIKNGEKYYRRILADRDKLRTITLDKKSQAELLGRLYIDEEILDVTQMSCVKSEIDKPTYNYSADQDNAWAFYNHVTHALKKAHPRNWLSDSQKFHDFIVTDLLSQMGIQITDTVDTNDDLLDLSDFSVMQDVEIADSELVNYALEDVEFETNNDLTHALELQTYIIS